MSDIDDLLIEAKRVCGERWQKAPEYPWEVAARFGAEVERLRARETERENVADMWRNRCAVAEARPQNHELADEVAKLEAENAELRGQLTEELTSKFAETFGQFEVPALKARLAWFESREVMLKSDKLLASDMRAYERDNPKPEGT